MDSDVMLPAMGVAEQAFYAQGRDIQVGIMAHAALDTCVNEHSMEA